MRFQRKARASALTSVSSVWRGVGLSTGKTISFRPPRFTRLKGTWTVMVSGIACVRFMPPLVLTESEILKLLNVPDVAKKTGVRDRAVLELLYGTGLRNSELCSLTLDLLDLAEHRLRLQKGKGGKARVLPLGQEAQSWLELYLEQVRPKWLRNPACTAVFLDRWGAGPINRATLSSMVRSLGKKAGLGKAVTPHAMRHSCATHMLRRGAGLRHLQQMLGHEQLASTEHYTRVEVSDLRRVLLRCHPRENFRGPLRNDD